MAEPAKQKELSSEAVAIICPNTGFPIPTGIATTPESFKSSSFTQNSVSCHACGKTHVWDKKDAILLPVGKRKRETFEKRTILLDGGNFDHIRFVNCDVFVSRGNFSLTNSSFDGCKFRYFGEAEIISKLTLMLTGQSPG